MTGAIKFGFCATGSHDGVGIEIVDAKITRRHKNGEHVVFDGFYAALLPGTKFDQRIVIQDDDQMLQSLSGAIGATLRGHNRVRLEDPAFESLFQVYSDDQIGARTILTPSFMQRLMEVRRRFGITSCIIHDGRLLLQVPLTGGLFRPDAMLERSDLHREFQRLRNETQVVFGTIDWLKLDDDIGL